MSKLVYSYYLRHGVFSHYIIECSLCHMLAHLSKKLELFHDFLRTILKFQTLTFAVILDKQWAGITQYCSDESLFRLCLVMIVPTSRVTFYFESHSSSFPFSLAWRWYPPRLVPKHCEHRTTSPSCSGRKTIQRHWLGTWLIATS